MRINRKKRELDIHIEAKTDNTKKIMPDISVQKMRYITNDIDPITNPAIANPLLSSTIIPTIPRMIAAIGIYI